MGDDDMPQPNGPQPPKGHYEVRDHMAAGVLALYWIEPLGRDALITTFGAERLPLLSRAINKYLSGAAGEYQRGREAAVLELAMMDSAERAEVLSRARHPSIRLATVDGQEAGS
jgi:hypothetical protein